MKGFTRGSTSSTNTVSSLLCHHQKRTTFSANGIPKVTYETDAEAAKKYAEWVAANTAYTLCDANELVQGCTTSYAAFAHIVTQQLEADYKEWDFNKAIQSINEKQDQKTCESLIPKEEELMTRHFSSVIVGGWSLYNPNNVGCKYDAILSARLVDFQPDTATAVVSMDVVTPAERVSPSYRFFFSRITFPENPPEIHGKKDEDGTEGPSHVMGVNERREIALICSRAGRPFIWLTEKCDAIARRIWKKPLQFHIADPTVWERLPEPFSRIGEGGLSLEKTVMFTFDKQSQRWLINHIQNGDIAMGNPRARVEL